MITNHGEAELESAAIEIFEALNWKHVNAQYETFPDSMLGRDTPAEVILTGRLRSKLQELNPGLPIDAIDQAIERLSAPRHVMTAVAANHDVYDLLKEGIKVEVRNDAAELEVETVTVIDWTEPATNDYLLISQFKVAGDMYNRRCDLVGFVNGVPLVFVEFKAPHVDVKHAFDGNLTDYKSTIPHLFWPNAMIILSNGRKTRVGTVTAGWEHFADWKRVASESEAPQSTLERALRATCEQERLLDLVENFTLFMEVPRGQVKVLAKNHQYLGVNNAIEALENLGENKGKLGVFWHTQGSGKSISMVFFSQKVLRKIPGNWSFLVVTDRKELDDQIYGNFAAAGAITEPEAHAESRDHLKQLLIEDHRFVFTLIHKFGTERGQSLGVINDRDDLIIMADEAHRTQYDTLATNMRAALPKAAFIAFTGTPLMAGEESTREVFGDYVSVYDFRQSIEDGATVPLYYENRIPELQVLDPDRFSSEMENVLERAALDESEEARFAQHFAKEYVLITHDDRLNTIAEDIAEHFMLRGQQGKAMVISIDKATAVRMYDKVHGAWERRLEQLRRECKRASGEEQKALRSRLNRAEKTDMAVVVSQSQNEVKELSAKGADIIPHRKRMNEEDLATKFKDPDDELRIVFVTAMWMTGFDAPPLSTLYLDKPMRNHTLMQTIARANRVFPGKVSGELIDYIGVFRDLKKALAIYAAGPKETELPVKDKDAQAAELKAKIAEVRDFVEKSGIDFGALLTAKKLKWVVALDDAVDRLVINDIVKTTYLHHAAEAAKLWKAVKPHPVADEFGQEMWVIVRISQAIHELTEPVDVTGLMAEVEQLLQDSVAAEPYEFDPKQKRVDLSEIDFDALAKEFEKGKRNSTAQRLRGSLQDKVDALVRLNPTRVDYATKLQEMIDRYNEGSANIEEFFEQLKLFAQELTEEEKRGVSESLTEEELALFDLLTKPDPKLTKGEEAEVKNVVRELLAKLRKEVLVLDWKKKQQTRAAVQVAIEEQLDQLPKTYDAEIYRQKCSRVFEHVFEAYQGDGQSIYGEAA